MGQELQRQIKSSLGREKETEVQRDDVIQERDSYRKEKSNLQEEKIRLKKEISDGLSIAENSKNQVSGLQNEIDDLNEQLRVAEASEKEAAEETKLKLEEADRQKQD